MKRGEMLSAAILLATNAHADQFDRGGTPYILHPLKVMYYLKTSDEELQCVAVLHDILEDTKTTKQDLVQHGMSQRVIDGVFSLTKLPVETLAEYKHRVFSNLDAMLVKKQDLHHNSDIRRLKNKTVTEKDIDRLVKYQQFYLELENKLQENYK